MACILNATARVFMFQIQLLIQAHLVMSKQTKALRMSGILLVLGSKVAKKKRKINSVWSCDRHGIKRTAEGGGHHMSYEHILCTPNILQSTFFRLKLSSLPPRMEWWGVGEASIWTFILQPSISRLFRHANAYERPFRFNCQRIYAWAIFRDRLSMTSNIMYREVPTYCRFDFKLLS